MEAIFGVLIPVTWVVMLVVERLFPGKKPLPKVRLWLLKGTVFFLFAGFLNTIFPLVFTQMLGGRTLLHLQWMGASGALVGMLASDFVQYWLHRTMHRISFLWR